ncbi:hypothetical protein O7635_07660 [Asanoa sp. WMMD1127]|uniref:hypothetical protein n=1 Tax=Asanoa sp. WMMD1127 TaxID=3016107 RepID=UPI0024170651|nr:hypothetical protein [Asanoa sp. WMMD1127]MDG4821728.1 hypothetical protein [Asanoa sp. WMMD1127]
MTFANPFPSITASGQPVDPDLAVRTAALTTATQLFDAFLQGAQQGGVLAVIGGAGTGKTFLSGVLRGMADRADPPVQSFYAQVSATSFREVLGSFVRAVKRDDGAVQSGVRHLYAEVVADALEGSDLGRQLGVRLRDGRLDAVTLVQRLRLDRSAYLETLTQRLEELTDHPGIATALTLLLRPGFDDAVWTWLAGAEPAGVLRDRRITAALASDADALRAMGALVRVVCAPGRKLLLTFDELERAFGADRPVTEETATALRRFLAGSASAGAFVVLSGFASFLENLPEDVRDRIGSTIQTSPFEPEDIQQLVTTSRAAVGGPAAPPPFSPSVVEHLADLTAGVPRLIVDLSHRLVRATPATAATIDDTAIQTAAQAYVVERHGAFFAEEIRRTLVERRWKVETNRYVGLSSDSHVDFWVAESDGGEGCAILVADNVISPAEITHQRDRIFTVKEGLPTGEILLVVKGFLAQEADRQLTDLTGRAPLVAQPGRVGRDLTRLVERILASFTAQDAVERVGNRLDRLGQHQATMHQYVAQLALSMNELRTANEKQLAELMDRLEEQPRAVAAEETATRLPEAVEAMLADALYVLDELLKRVDMLFTDALHVAPDRARDTRMSLRARLRQRNTAPAAGVVALLQRLITAFRTELRLWWAREAEKPPSTRDVRTLDALCVTYAVACEYLPLFHLDELRHVTTRFVGDPDDPQADRATDVRASDLFPTLAGRVQTELNAPSAVRRR